MYRLLLIAALTFTVPAFANEPREVLDGYFQILTSRDFASIAQMMDKRDMAKLKQMMDGAIKAQVKRGNYSLQERVFGKKVKLNDVDAATAEFYLEELANEILQAANTSHFFVHEPNILGEVVESDSIIHFVARLQLSQDGKSTQEIYVYTLVKDGEDWKLRFPPTIKQLLAVIEASAQL